MNYDESIVRVYEMLGILHERGYEQLRIVPGLSASGMYYRASITFAQNVRANHGALAVDAKQCAMHSSSQSAKIFGWDDATKADASTLADFFVARFPIIASRGLATDPPYVAWFRDEVLPAVRQGAAPIAYADFDVSLGGSALATTDKTVRLAMPPPGLSG